MAAGIYSLANICVGAMAAILTGPIGQTFPDEGGKEFPWLREVPGYHLSVSDASGSLMGEIRSKSPVRVDLQAISPDFINAVLAAEDSRFLDHEGIDPIGSLGALADTLRGKLRGGSGITQQMVKNTVVGADQTLSRKMIEAVLAARLHKSLGSREILRSYLESAWFGRGQNGAMRAPDAWFGKSWDQVTLAESATLAAMLKGPGFYDPHRFPERVTTRRNAILDRMLDLGWIDTAEHGQATAEAMKTIPLGSQRAPLPSVRTAIDEQFRTGNLPDAGEVLLSLDPVWQDIVESSIKKAMRSSFRARPPEAVDKATLENLQVAKNLPREYLLPLPSISTYTTAVLLEKTKDGWSILTLSGLEDGIEITDPHDSWTPAAGEIVALDRISPKSAAAILPVEAEAAVVLIDPRSGEIIAAYGSVDHGLSEFDRTRAMRQPGSAIKPFLYLAALDMGFGPQTGVEDVLRTYTTAPGVTWTPRNYDNSQSGMIPMYAALERSSNLASAWIANTIGIEAMGTVAEAAGAYPPGEMGRNLTSSLGSTETTLLRMTASFGAILDGGVAKEPHIVRGALTGDGDILDLRPQSADLRPIASVGAIDAVVRMLRGVVVRGTASEALADLPLPIVGKTGTTQNYRDAWFIGGTPQLAIGVWIGRDDNKTIPGNAAGGKTAAPIAASILARALEAGLIYENGLRDASSLPAIQWPPSPVERASGRIISAEEVLAGTDGYRDSKAPEIVNSESPSSSSMDHDAFWGVTDVQESNQAPPAPFETPDRNSDILGTSTW